MPDGHRKRSAPSPAASSASPSASLRLQRPAKKPRRSGTRGAGFSAQEVDSLLCLLRERLPLSKEEWEDAARAHVERFPELDRTVEALRRKFARLHRTRPEDDDVGSLPKDARAAKAVLEAMTRRAGASADSGTFVTLLSRQDGEESDGNADDESNDGSDRRQSMEPPAPRDNEPSRPVEGEGEQEQPTEPAGSCPQCQQSRPTSERDDVMAMLRVSMLQMQQQREQDAVDRQRRETMERERREEERRRREEDRAADRLRMDSLMAMVAQSHKTVETLVLALMKDRSGG